MKNIHKNPNQEWQTYETLFNKNKFRKSNSPFDVGLYIIPLAHVNIWVRDHIPRQQIELLVACFFSELDSQTVTDLSARHCKWRVSKENIPFKEDSHVVMIYNYQDNDMKSNALGTTNTNGNVEQSLQKLQAHWTAWKTASRTNVVRVEPLKAPYKTIAFDWPWVVEIDRKNEPQYSENCYVLKDRSAQDFSIKTGVCWVGSEDQRTTKDVLDGWPIAALRSDYVADVDARMKVKDANFPTNIIILTELLSVTENKKRKSKPLLKEDLADYDGMIVRDLSPLDKGKIYIPPTSIPFIHPESPTIAVPEFAFIDDNKWQNFWKDAWAAAVGRAKAQFLLRYGLQHINPNPQNYLLEFKKPSVEGAPLEATGIVVIRDLADASLNREVLWAIYGPEGELPPQAKGDRPKLKDLRHPLLQYEFSQMESVSQETGTTPVLFGEPGVQLLWHRYSAFANVQKLERLLKELEGKISGEKLLSVMHDWGIAHCKAYFDEICSSLNVKLTYPEPPALSPNKDLNWESDASKVIHQYLASAEGQERLRAYQKNLWRPL